MLFTHIIHDEQLLVTCQDLKKIVVFQNTDALSLMFKFRGKKITKIYIVENVYQAFL